MKKFYVHLHKGQDAPVSIPLLVCSFLGGWLLATGLFFYLSHGLRATMFAWLH